jgi:pyruvate formate lyase activating enzyme
VVEDEVIPIEAILLALRRHRGWVDGVVVSGGEPTLHKGLGDLISMFRTEGLEVKLDTNGSNPEVLADLLDRGMLEYVAMDVKAPLDEAYAGIAGADVDLDAIRRSIDLLRNGTVPYEFRTTVCPAQLDEEDIERIARAVSGARLLYLQPFRPVNCYDRSFGNIAPYNPDRMRELCRIASTHVERCIVRGDTASEMIAAGQAAEGF